MKKIESQKDDENKCNYIIKKILKTYFNCLDELK